ncbi:hypothetical protein [Microbacterium ulmi]|uniref:Uncharacterized protein n=1 Tax=Microbacterium ulmi TaxID=179095 RepID=A0A7Y2LYT2_9MICO|nr:hypothetical protein [Microbacterium ulmi]NII71330.1 hypothetical protein [Microbacterium ulmi]NNH02634.1 hypothetical protein [Microbacterium ulmi]
MTFSSLRLGAAALVIAATAVFATGCATTPQAAPTEDSAPAPTQTDAAPEGTATPDAPESPADPTCETLIPPATVADFEAVGWTVQPDAFWIGSLEIPGGVFCRWGDFSTASDHMQMFGWAPISADDAKSVQEELVAGGWRKEEASDGVYITESPDTALTTDDEGYGLTYLFRDGSVTFADTKQGLLLVEWPRS